MPRGVTVWFTGLSGAGKTTVARRVEEILKGQGERVERLDGDIVRQSLTRDLGFSKEDRDRNIERVAFVSKLLTRQDVIVLAAFISPYRAERNFARRETESFLEVYVKAPLDTLIARDVKGLYKKALAGELPHFTGVSDPYEEPNAPDLVLETDTESAEESAGRVLALLAERGFTASATSPAPAAFRESRSERPPLPPVPGAIAPHGGRLVNLLVSGDEAESERRRAASLRRLVLDERTAADLEMIGTGALSPLTGFMGQRDYASVVESMRLADGLVWSLPVTLSASAEDVRGLSAHDEVALVDGAGLLTGLLDVTEVFRYDRAEEARRVFGTEDASHPGVARLLGQGEYLVGGSVRVLAQPKAGAFPSHRLTPLETRTAFDEKGWRRIVAFQTRNPVHRAHEYIQKAALETVDGLLLHPLVGATKADDISPEVRMRSYLAILDAYYPRERVMLSVFPAAMRYAGPREAIFHALCRKNYGCTHFIVGRDHAGVGNFYGTYDAQRIFSRFSAEEIGIQPMFFEHAFYCRRCAGMATAKTCPHGEGDRVALSGTRVRALLRSGTLPPPEYSRPEVARILADAMGGAAEA